MNAAAANLLREFADEARLRGRRTKFPEEREAAESLERQFRRMIEEIEANARQENMTHATR